MRPTPPLSLTAARIRPAVFGDLQARVDRLASRGIELVPLQIGDTWLAPPAAVQRALEELDARDASIFRYGATAGVSVVKLYAGAFFPGLMLAGLYVGYVIIVAKWKPHFAPPLAQSERLVPLPPLSQTLSARSGNALKGLFGALRIPSLPKGQVATQLFVSLLPALSIGALLLVMYGAATAPIAAVDTSGLVQSGGSLVASDDKTTEASGLQEPPKEEGGLQEPPQEPVAGVRRTLFGGG